MRLIDADALKASIEEKDRYNLGGENRIIVCGMLDDAPTIDAEPVKHGHWIDDHDYAICSLCDRVIYDAYYEFRDKNDASFHNYCPYCGAKMDGESE